MMKRLGDFVVKKRWWIVLVWILGAVLIVSFSPKLSSITSNDQSSFIPSNYESVRAMGVAKKVSAHSQAPTDIIVFKNVSNEVLGTEDQQKINDVVDSLNVQKLAQVISVKTSARQLAPDNKTQLASITYAGTSQDTDTIKAVKTIRNALTKLVIGTKLKASITGGEAIAYDTQGASDRALKIVSIGTILLVLLLPAFIFRSPLAGLFPLIAVSIVFTLSSSLIAVAGHAFNFHVSQQLSILFTVVLFGIGTDYILFLLFRYREKLRSGDHTKAAVSFALSRAGEAIFSAALVVLTSFAALFFAKFGIFSSLAPGLVICVAVMMIAALTLVPALLAIIGEKVFWPSKAWMVASEAPTISKRVGGLIARRPGLVVGVVVTVLLVLASFSISFRSDFSSFSQPPKGTESANAYNDLTAAYPAGTLSPTQIYVTSKSVMESADLKSLESKLSKTQGVSVVLPAYIVKDGLTAEITVILKNDGYSSTALSNVHGPIRDAAHSFNTVDRTVYVGGLTSIFADIQSVTNRDLSVIFPIAAVFIFVILAVLLKSLIAPLFLLLCVSLGYVATLGTTTFIFQNLSHNPGIISFIPLFMYIFVVAIGTDYNILTITRLREEIKEGNNPRRAADLTVEHSSATVAAAGLILAATFGSLILGGLTFLMQMGTAIAIGVSLAAFVIAPFLIPSLAALIGYAIWWPGHKFKK